MHYIGLTVSVLECVMWHVWLVVINPCSLRRQDIRSIWDWRCSKGSSSSLSVKYSNYTCVTPVWWNDIAFKSISMSLQNASVHEGFSIWSTTSPIMIDTPWWAGKCPTSAFGRQQQHQNTLSSSITLNIDYIHALWWRTKCFTHITRLV